MYVRRMRKSKKNRLLAICLMMVLLNSCSVIETNTYSPFTVYSSGTLSSLRKGNPTQIIINNNPKTYEMILQGGGVFDIIIGSWYMSSDTINLMPETEIYKRNGKWENVEIEYEGSVYQSIWTIPLAFILKGDQLFDVSDYKKYFPEEDPILVEKIESSRKKASFIRVKKLKRINRSIVR